MKRKIIYLFVALALLFSLIAVVGTGTAAAAGNWYVSTTGNDTTGDGSSGNPWLTINYAIGQAGGGDTINVAAGTFSETVTVNQSLILRGAQAGVDARGRVGSESIIVGTRYVGVGQNRCFPAIYVTTAATDVTIDGFTLKGKRGTVTIYADTSRLINNIVYPIGGDWGKPPALVFINGAAMTGGGSDIPNGNARDVTVQYNDISPETNDTLWPSGANALRIDVSMATGTPSVLVDNNYLHNASHYPTALGAGLGIMVNNAAATISVTNNVINNNGSDGMWTSAALFNTLTVTGNYIQNNSATGINIPAGTVGNIQIHNNDILNNVTQGIANANSGNIVDATNNWWGDASGPYDPVGTQEVPPCSSDPAADLNADGTGDGVSDYVKYCGWTGMVESTPTPTPEVTPTPTPTPTPSGCPTCLHFALTVDASAESCCTVKVNGQQITVYPWTHEYDRGTAITLEASGGACCQFGNWTIYTQGFSNTYTQSTVSFNMQSNINAVVSCSPTCPPPEVTPTPTPTTTPPTVHTNKVDVSSVTTNSATLKGNLADLG